MLKTIGAAFVLIGTIFGGYSNVLRLKKREKLLRDLAEALEKIQAELTFHAPPLARIFGGMMGVYPGEIGGFFGEWAGTLGGAAGGEAGVIGGQLTQTWFSLLTEEEQSVLHPLFFTLGRYDIEVQKNALEEAKVHLNRYAQKAAEDRLRLSRVYMVLSIALGVMVVLVCL